jgi:hypothetical protein
MKQISTGAGLVALSVGMVATAFVATHRNGGEAFAQGTGTERRIVSAGVFQSGGTIGNSFTQTYAGIYAYRIWSDNAVDLRCLGSVMVYGGQSLPVSIFNEPSTQSGNFIGWRTVDNGTSGFRPLTDVDMSGETDAGDISQVLLDFNTRSEDLPPPPIDCNINAPR